MIGGVLAAVYLGDLDADLQHWTEYHSKGRG